MKIPNIDLSLKTGATIQAVRFDADTKQVYGLFNDDSTTIDRWVHMASLTFEDQLRLLEQVNNRVKASIYPWPIPEKAASETSNG